MSEALVITVPVKLESPNRSRGYHWRLRHRERGAWQAAIGHLVGAQLPLWTLRAGTTAALDERGQFKVKEIRKKERRRVTITRFVANGHQLIRDEDNLRFCAKPINDALKRLGLIYDDSRNWLEQPQIEQVVSPSGLAHTVIRIERLQEASRGAA